MSKDETIGPCMAALTERQQTFVRHLCEFGGTDTDAARAAGYKSDNPSSIRNWAYQLAHNPKVRAALREEAEKRIASCAPLAAQRLTEILNNPASKDHFKAIVEVMNRSGMIVATKHEVEITDSRTADELRAFIIAIAKQQGLDPTKLLAPTELAALPAPYVQDAEFTEVTPHEDWEDYDDV